MIKLQNNLITFFVWTFLLIFSYSQTVKEMDLSSPSDEKENKSGYFFTLKNKAKGPRAYLANIIIFDNGSGNIDTLFLSKVLPVINDKTISRVEIVVNSQLTDSSYFAYSVNDYEYVLISASKDSLVYDLHVFMNKGEKTVINELRFKGNYHISNSYLHKVIDTKLPVPITPRLISDWKQRLSSIEYLELSDSITIIQKDSSNILLFTLKEGKMINFNFLIGYQPSSGNSQNSGNWSGHILLNFKNLFGNGKKFFIEWDKPSALTEELQLKYHHPYLLNMPFHAEAGYKRLIQDTLFNLSGKNFGFVFPWKKLLLTLNYNQTNATNDSSLVNNKQPLKTESKLWGLSIHYNTMNKIINPVKGTAAHLEISTGNYDAAGSDTSFSGSDMVKLKGMISGIFKIRSPFYLFLNGKTEIVTTSSATVPIAEKYFLGGSQSLRGYREKQYITEFYTLWQTELRLMFSKRSRLHFFTDCAIYGNKNDKKSFLNSYGFGFLISGKNGFMVIDYGIRSGSPFNSGMLHFRLINEF